ALNGQLRHVHLAHAFANLDATRTARWVAAHLVPVPVALREGPTWGEYCLGDIDQLFFAIHRLEFSDTIDDNTEGKFVARNLVDGERCASVTAGRKPVELRVAESIVISACVGTCTLRNRGQPPPTVGKG